MMNLDMEIINVINEGKFLKSDRNFEAALEKYKKLEEEKIVQPRGYTIASRIDETSFKCYFE